jgi:hypothetical protein
MYQFSSNIRKMQTKESVQEKVKDSVGKLKEATDAQSKRK